MPLCPECETTLDIEADEIDEGDVIVCEECGSEYEVVTTDPLELVKVDEGYDEDEEESYDEEEE